ncbi:type II CRISPR RNA-guided endonuclease Cas9 [Anaerostipes sp.]|uniref:type II CRISPR RNA-guided endonuclease Cas9 n=1 Tax=Anaerostipes sp. TaxID=1872530 RepID=UPI003527F878
MSDNQQSGRMIASVLQYYFPESKIVFVKEKLIPSFKRDFHLISSYGHNHLQAAKDAYITIVVGNVYHTKFTMDPAIYFKNHKRKDYDLNRLFLENISRDGQIAWESGPYGSIQTVRKEYAQNHIAVTKRVVEVKGGLFKQMPLKKGHGEYPLKTNDPRFGNIAQYGGYTNVTGSYFVLVESMEKGEKRISLEYVPVYLHERLEDDPGHKLLKEYLVDHRKLNHPKILLAKVRKNSLLKIDGFYYRLNGRSGNALILTNAVEVIMDDWQTKTANKISGYMKRRAIDKKARVYQNEFHIQELEQLYDFYLDKLENGVYKNRKNNQAELIHNEKEQFMELKTEDQCVLLTEIKKLFVCSPMQADLTLIGGSKHTGMIAMSSNVTKADFAVIAEDPLGLRNKVIYSHKGEK